jgi:adenosylhomocysteinase
VVKPGSPGPFFQYSSIPTFHQELSLLDDKGDDLSMNYDVKDLKLAKDGALRIEWAKQNMSVLNRIRKRFEKQKPLKGVRLSACLHVTTETAALKQTLKAGGAKVVLCASNPLSTQDDVAASLVKHDKIPVFAIKGENHKTYYKHIYAVLDTKPQFTMDDGADLVSTLHSERSKLLPNVIGGTEETTTGIIRLRSMAADGVLQYPIIAVNDAQTKHFFDNRQPTACLPGPISSYAVMAGAVAAWPCGPGGWVPMSSLPKWTRCRRWRPSWMVST